MKCMKKWYIYAPKFEFNSLQKFHEQLHNLYPEPFTFFSHDNLLSNSTVGGIIGLLIWWREVLRKGIFFCSVGNESRFGYWWGSFYSHSSIREIVEHESMKSDLWKEALEKMLCFRICFAFRCFVCNFAYISYLF